MAQPDLFSYSPLLRQHDPNWHQDPAEHGCLGWGPGLSPPRPSPTGSRHRDTEGPCHSHRATVRLLRPQPSRLPPVRPSLDHHGTLTGGTVEATPTLSCKVYDMELLTWLSSSGFQGCRAASSTPGLCPPAASSIRLAVVTALKSPDVTQAPGEGQNTLG